MHFPAEASTFAVEDDLDSLSVCYVNFQIHSKTEHKTISSLRAFCHTFPTTEWHRIRGSHKQYVVLYFQICSRFGSNYFSDIGLVFCCEKLLRLHYHTVYNS